MIMKNKKQIDEALKQPISDCKSYDDLPMFMDTKQVAELLNLSRTTIYDLAKEHEIPVIRFGAKIIIPRDEFVEWVKSHTEGTHEV